LSIARDLKESILQHKADYFALQRHGAVILAEREQSQRDLQRCIQESIALKSEREASKAKRQGELAKHLSGKDARLAEFRARLVEGSDKAQAEVPVRKTRLQQLCLSEQSMPQNASCIAQQYETHSKQESEVMTQEKSERRALFDRYDEGSVPLTTPSWCLVWITLPVCQL
jgi:hypothetical protein